MYDGSPHMGSFAAPWASSWGGGGGGGNPHAAVQPLSYGADAYNAWNPPPGAKDVYNWGQTLEGPSLWPSDHPQSPYESHSSSPHGASPPQLPSDHPQSPYESHSSSSYGDLNANAGGNPYWPEDAGAARKGLESGIAEAYSNTYKEVMNSFKLPPKATRRASAECSPPAPPHPTDSSKEHVAKFTASARGQPAPPPPKKEPNYAALFIQPRSGVAAAVPAAPNKASAAATAAGAAAPAAGATAPVARALTATPIRSAGV